MTSGGRYVMMTGTPLMLLWSASNWDTHTLEVSEVCWVLSLILFSSVNHTPRCSQNLEINAVLTLILMTWCYT